jgi:peroxiredoxin
VALQRRWAALGEAGAVTVVGVSLDETEAPHEGAGAPGPGFPVRTDLRKQAGRLMGKLGYETTPVTVLVDRRGRPRLVLPPPADEVAVEAQARAVRAALGAL